MLNVKKLKQDFPIFERKVNGQPLVYLDSAATSHKPWQVCEEMDVYYCHSNANIHRGIHTLSEESTLMYERVRDIVQNHLSAQHRHEVVFTHGATEALNQIAQGLASQLNSSDEIVLTEMEHHANLLPWQRLAKQTGAKLKFIPIDDRGQLASNWADYITDQVKIVSFCHISNMLGTINPVTDIAKAAKKVGAITVLDAAQSVGHMPVDVQKLDIDLMVFSAHKMLGPTGVGVLYGRQEVLCKLEPLLVGGEMISQVSYESAAWQDLPWKLEAGTPNIAGVIGLGRAVEYLEKVGLAQVDKHVQQLTSSAIAQLSDMNGVSIFGPSSNRGGVISFSVEGVPAHDLATLLDEDGIAVRSGHHCTQPLHGRLGIESTARVSFYLYNEQSDIEALGKGIKRAQKIFNHSKSN